MTSLVTADTSKAFDSVEHGRLLEKLGWYGIDDRWFRAWLSDRTQSVRGGSGAELPVTHGVVQGSIMGPVLFLVFSNDLSQHVPHGKLVMYADDVQFIDSDSPRNMSELNPIPGGLRRDKRLARGGRFAPPLRSRKLMDGF